ncbi:unnamed protein product, partial [Scytosiphon promiscuus]
MARYCSSCCCVGGVAAGSKAFQAGVMMALLASPSKAFLPALSSVSVARHVRLTTWTALPLTRSASRRYLAHETGALHRSNNPARASRRALGSLSAATDGAKDAAMAAVQAAEEALDQAARDAGSAVDASEVQATVAAARAAARNAMESLRIGRDGIGGEGGAEAPDAFPTHTVTSPARSAVQAALSAIAEAQTAADAPAADTSAAAQEAVSMVQEALDRRDSAAAELAAVSSDGTPSVAGVETPPQGKGISLGGSDGDGGEETTETSVAAKESTKEPESARWSRNNPAASHSHMAHLLWRQVAGPGDTVIDCTAGNGYDSLELAKTIALKDGLGSLYIVDVQERALEATRERLESELGGLALKRSTFINGNFRQMPAELEPMSVQLVVYNLGWLPGGDKSITTKLEDTLESIEAAKPLIKHGGMISIMLYRGHAE